MILKVSTKELFVIGFAVIIGVGVGFFLLRSKAQVSPKITEMEAQAETLMKQGRHPEALKVYTELLPLAERSLGTNHPRLATILNNVASLYEEKEKAVPLLERVLEIREKQLGPEHRLVAMTLNHLALAYEECSTCPDPEPFFKRALQIRKKEFGPKNPVTRESLDNLAWFYRHRGQHAKAENLLKDFQ